jgi:hypothetical protein
MSDRHSVMPQGVEHSDTDERLCLTLRSLALTRVEGSTAVLRALLGEGCVVTLVVGLGPLLDAAAQVALAAAERGAAR